MFSGDSQGRLKSRWNGRFHTSFLTCHGPLPQQSGYYVLPLCVLQSPFVSDRESGEVVAIANSLSFALFKQTRTPRLGAVTCLVQRQRVCTGALTPVVGAMGAPCISPSLGWSSRVSAAVSLLLRAHSYPFLQRMVPLGIDAWDCMHFSPSRRHPQ